MHILKIHRILIASGIVVCLSMLGGSGHLQQHTQQCHPLHAALVVAAMALGIYLHSIRKW